MKRNEKNTSNILFFIKVVWVTCIFLQLSLASDCSDSTCHTITVCDGEAASFTWPCDLPYDHAEVMTLTFKGLSTEGQRVANISGSGKVTVSEEYSDRVTPRGTSGVRLDSVSILDSGIYLTTAALADGTVLERHFTLDVQVPPLLMDNRVKMAVHTTSPGCQSITCGTLLFPGFPALSFHWQSPKGIIHKESQSNSKGMSTVHGCPLLPGKYSCRVVGSALSCRKRYAASATPAVLSSSVLFAPDSMIAKASKSKEQETKELVLMIMVPIVAVMVPLVILSLWLLSHLLSDCSLTCGKDDTEAGVSPSSTPPAGERSPAIVSPSASGTVPLTSDKQPEEGEDEGNEGADADYKEETLDDDEADPTVPLVIPESYTSTILGDDGEGSDTQL